MKTFFNILYAIPLILTIVLLTPFMFIGLVAEMLQPEQNNSWDNRDLGLY